MGYTHKFKVLVNGEEVLFEPDEEGNYRAVLSTLPEEKKARNIDTALLQVIADTIKSSLSE